MLSKLMNLVILIPLAVVLIILSVANRHGVTLAFNPFRPEDQVLSITAPFFVFIFLAVILGVIIGSLATWFTQGKYRKRARSEARMASKWQVEADRHKSRAEQLAGNNNAGLPSK